jgi:hypothetical protein
VKQRAAFAALFLIAACNSSPAERKDGGATSDAAAALDSSIADAGSTDAGTPSDSGSSDTGIVSGADAGPLDAAPGCTAVALLSDIELNTFEGCRGFGPMSCHVRQPYAGALNLTDGNAWAMLVSHTSSRSTDLRVVPGHPERSFVWRKLNNLNLTPTEGDPMPKGEAIAWRPLPADQLEAIRCWILEGAPNN